MSVGLISVVVVVVLLGLILLEVPIGLAVIGSGLVGIVLLNGFGAAMAVLATVPLATVANYALFVIPMYVLLGALVSGSGIGDGLYSAANRLLHRLPGGLAAAAVAATSFFSGISGSSAADVTAFGRISVTGMANNGYNRAYAGAVVAAAGAFAVLIPPTIGLVIYGALAQESVGALIVAAVIPGVMSCVLLAVFVVLQGAFGRHKDRSHISAAVPSPRPQPVDMSVPKAGGRTGWRWEVTAVAYTLLLAAIVVGGVYLGIFTASEAGAIGAFVAIFVVIASHRKGDRSLWRFLLDSVMESSRFTSMVFLLIIGGAILSYFIASAGITIAIADWTLNLSVAPLAIAGVLLLVLLLMGTVLDALSTMLLIVPIAAPVIESLGLDPIWFGILVLKVVEIGLITPPVGINVFIISGIIGIPSEKVFLRVLPFVVLDIAFTIVLFFFPDIVLWLPRQAGLI